jgi:hypothetical protein
MLRIGLCPFLLLLMILMQPSVSFNFQAIQTCKNILKYKPPMDPNVDIVAHLLQGLCHNVDAVPSWLRQEFISILDDLIRVCQPGVHLTSAAITTAVGPLYPDPPDDRSDLRTDYRNEQDRLDFRQDDSDRSRSASTSSRSKMERLRQVSEDLHIQLQRAQPTSSGGRRGPAAHLACADLVDDDSDVPVSFKHVDLTVQLRLDSVDSPDDPTMMYCHIMPGRAGIRYLPDQYNNRYPRPRPFL